MANKTTGLTRALLALTLLGSGPMSAAAESAYDRRIREIRELSAKTYKGAPSPAAYMKYAAITPANVAKLHPEVPDAYTGPKVRDQVMTAHKAVTGLAAAAREAAEDAKKSDEPNKFIASQAQKAAAVLGKAYDDKLKPAADNLGEIHGVLREMANILELIAGGNAAASGQLAGDALRGAAAESQPSGAAVVAQANQELQLIEVVRGLNSSVISKASNGATMAMGAGKYLNAAEGAAAKINERGTAYKEAVSDAMSGAGAITAAVDAVGAAAKGTTAAATDVGNFAKGPLDNAIDKVAACSRALRDAGAAQQGALPRSGRPAVQLAMMIASPASAQPSSQNSLVQRAVQANADALSAVRAMRQAGSRVLPPIRNAGGVPEANVDGYALSASEVGASNAKVGDTGKMERRARSDAAVIRSQVKDDE